jgi:hypothetical protein
MKKLAIKTAIVLICCVATSCMDPFYHCDEFDFGNEIPNCIIEEIADFKETSICEDASVKEYKFQGEIVYVFNSACCCDMQSPVLDYHCNVLGALGGIAGNTKMNNGEDFSSAKYRRTVWHN